MNYLDSKTRERIIWCLVEGCSIRGTCRMTGVAKATVLKLLVDLGTLCSDFQDRELRALPCKRVQVDEIWSFCHTKQKRVRRPDQVAAGHGDAWTWTALCADTKLILSWLVGKRDGECATAFIGDVAARLAGRIQLTSDGHDPYLEAVEAAWGGKVDYARVVKEYSGSRYKGCKISVECGQPDARSIGTSFVERCNLTMRMGMRRFIRKTSGFSKKVENHDHAVAIHFMYYNFCRVHQALRVSPAMAAGVADRLWEIQDLVRMLEEADAAKEEALGPRRTRRKVAAGSD